MFIRQLANGKILIQVGSRIFQGYPVGNRPA
jgi:hypothetical protein